MKKSPSDFHAHFDRIADLRSVYIRRNRAYYRDIQNWLGYVITADASVIELGSGTGNVIGNLKNRKKTGIDFSSRMLEQARLENHKGKTMISFAEQAERVHAELYKQALAAVEAGHDLKNAEIYICPVCGDIHIGEPNANCPICGVKPDKYRKV